MSSKTPASPKNAAFFLKHFLIEDLGKLIENKGQSFLKFIPIIVGMEFLGACYDDKPFGETRLSRKRFKKALDLMGGKYLKFDGSHKPKYPCLYEDFRCPIIHQFRTNSDSFRLSEFQEGISEKIALDYHLSEEEARYEDGIYVIVLEVLYNDFKTAVTKTIENIEKGNGVLNLKKLKEPHVIIRDMDLLQTT